MEPAHGRSRAHSEQDLDFPGNSTLLWNTGAGPSLFNAFGLPRVSRKGRERLGDRPCSIWCVFTRFHWSDMDHVGLAARCRLFKATSAGLVCLDLEQSDNNPQASSGPVL